MRLAGLVLADDKNCFLLPVHAPLPTNATQIKDDLYQTIRSNGEVLLLTKEGMVTVGIPIGTDAFVHQQLKTKTHHRSC